MGMRYGERTRMGTLTSSWLPRGAFNPSSLAPSLWLDASDSSTITSSGSPATVSQWNNKGSVVCNFAQGTAAAQPTTGATTLNGLNVLDFDGGDSLISSVTNDWNFLHDGTGVYFVCSVIQVGSSSNPDAIYSYLASSSAASANRGATFTYEDRTPSNNATRVLISNGTSLIIDNINQNIWSPQTWTIVTHVIDAGNAATALRNTVKLNDGIDFQTNTTSGTPSTGNAANALRVGASGTGTFLLTGKIGEIIVVSGVNATRANRDLVIEYLRQKWAVF